MKFFHLSDLHIGKSLHHHSLKEDQVYILDQIVAQAARQRPDAIVIAGDIYDKTMPAAEAVTIFNDFLTALSRLPYHPTLLIISGNHDSGERLDYAAQLLTNQNIYIAGREPQTVELTDEYGTVSFLLLPFLKPSYVRQLFPEQPASTYSEAVAATIARARPELSGGRRVLVSHQFYAGHEAPQTSESETLSVGGLDQVETAVVEDFDYVALGHLHRPQAVGQEHIRYCGTPLKYSVSEATDRKILQVVELKAPGTAPELAQYPLVPLREVRALQGTLQELLQLPVGVDPEDYVSLTLTDEGELFQPKEQLEGVYTRILEVRLSNTRTQARIAALDQGVELKDPLTNFRQFFREMQGRELSERETALLQQVFLTAGEEA